MSVPLDLSSNELKAVEAVKSAIRSNGVLTKATARALVKSYIGKRGMNQDTFSRVMEAVLADPDFENAKAEKLYKLRRRLSRWNTW